MYKQARNTKRVLITHLNKNTNTYVNLWDKFFVCYDVFPSWILQKNGCYNRLLGSWTDQLYVNISTCWTGSIQSTRSDRYISRSDITRCRLHVTADNNEFQLVVFYLHPVSILVNFNASNYHHTYTQDPTLWKSLAVPHHLRDDTEWQRWNYQITNDDVFSLKPELQQNPHHSDQNW